MLEKNKQTSLEEKGVYDDMSSSLTADQVRDSFRNMSMRTSKRFPNSHPQTAFDTDARFISQFTRLAMKKNCQKRRPMQKGKEKEKERT